MQKILMKTKLNLQKEINKFIKSSNKNKNSNSLIAIFYLIIIK